MSKGNKIKTAIFLEARQVAALKEIQKKVGVPMSESIRRAIDKYISEEGRK
jgi:predicted DNA-binding protein